MDFIQAEIDKEFSAIGFKSQRKNLKVGDHQTGKSNKKVDELREALKPGKRRSKKGNIYYEYRKNRSDLKNKI